MNDKYLNVPILYVDPFVFEIRTTVFQHYSEEVDGTYYIGNEGEYVKEEYIHQHIDDAKKQAMGLLNEFYDKQIIKIKEF